MMNESKQAKTDYDVQNDLVRALLAGMRKLAASKNARLVETHISWVLLAGRYAYKIKKAVNLGFLDYRSLEARLHNCNEEIRLNRRLAPKIYLNVIAIGGSADKPVLGEYPALEYAVRMRRFPVSGQLDRLVKNDKILPQHIDSLAATMANFHVALPAAGVNSSFGKADAIRSAAAQNFEQLPGLTREKSDLDRLAAVQLANSKVFAACKNLFEQRLARGYVRECHGDLHLGNIVLVGEHPVPFDGIEFNPALRWIDVMSEIAFTVMDLLHYRRADLAFRFLNAYLENTGDYGGVKLLPFYMAYRAMVRAKVAAIRASQSGLSPAVASAARIESRDYLALAEECFVPKQPFLLVTHGLPGSGKSTFARLALERLQAVRLRSDVERKRLFGLSPLADSHAQTGVDLYSREVTQQTYGRLGELARDLLQGGMSVIVDAAFVTRAERMIFEKLARELGVRFVIAAIQAGENTLRTRIIQRQTAANDASEADVGVLQKVKILYEHLLPAEQAHAVHFDNDGEGLGTDAAAWDKLNLLLSRPAI